MTHKDIYKDILGMHQKWTWILPRDVLRMYSCPKRSADVLFVQKGYPPDILKANSGLLGGNPIYHDTGRQLSPASYTSGVITNWWHLKTEWRGLDVKMSTLCIGTPDTTIQTRAQKKEQVRDRDSHSLCIAIFSLFFFFAGCSPTFIWEDVFGNNHIWRTSASFKLHLPIEIRSVPSPS